MATQTSALALSGGGYRATLFALGSLWRLNKLGILKNLNRITAVSGGSIALAYLALHWKELIFDKNGIAQNFQEVVVDPLQIFCSKRLDVKTVTFGWIHPLKTVGEKLAEAYDDRLFHKALLSDIPVGDGIPEFIFYATNYTTGSSVRLTPTHISDYKLGKTPSTYDITLSQAIASSSAFPPLLSPIIFNSKKWEWIKTDYAFLHDETSLKKRLVLADGGLYDNLGVEAIWKEKKDEDDYYDNVLVCDAGAPFTYGFDSKGSNIFSKLLHVTGLKRNIVSQFYRMTDVMIDQQRSLRKRQLIQNYNNKVYGGAYWGITTKISAYDEAEHKLAVDNKTTKDISKIGTRLTAFSKKEQALLINWGYALCDAAMRNYVDKNLKISQTLPLPDYALA